MRWCRGPAGTLQASCSPHMAHLEAFLTLTALWESLRTDQEIQPSNMYFCIFWFAFIWFYLFFSVLIMWWFSFVIYFYYLFIVLLVSTMFTDSYDHLLTASKRKSVSISRCLWQTARGSSPCWASPPTVPLPSTSCLWPFTTVSAARLFLEAIMVSDGPAEPRPGCCVNPSSSQFPTWRPWTQWNSPHATATVWTIGPVTYQVGGTDPEACSFRVLLVPL